MYECCLDASLALNLDYLWDKHNSANHDALAVTITCNFLMIITTLSGTISLYILIICWYFHNPLDGLRAARNLKVGLPEQVSNNTDLSVDRGYPVPEADREVVKVPTYIVKSSSVKGVPQLIPSHM